MARIKDSSVLNVDLTSGVKEYNANKKTALNITPYAGWDFTTDDAKTIKISKDDKVVTITNASKLKYIKTESESEYSDLIEMGLIDYIGNVTVKKNKYTGTIYNDTITGSDYKDTILGKSGNDIIDGGKNDDAITGGEGRNTILLYTAKNFGNDTVTLTKGEHLYLKLADATDMSKVTSEIKGKDLVITVNKGQPSYESSVTIKNYTKKDVITSEGELKIIGSDGAELYNFRGEEFFNTTYMDADHYTKSSFTGTWINDEVNAENFTTTVKKGKTEATTKGVTINLGGATFINDATGSKYADTIKGVDGYDDIRGGKGNDKITGGAGYNILYYSKGDGHDTVNLTKGEELELHFDDLELDELHIDYVNKKKDVKIWYEENGAEAGSITLNNFGKKNPTDIVFITDKDNKIFDFTKNYIETIVNKSNFTGTLLNDFIDASKSDELTKRNKHVNMVLNGGKGNDKIVGSQFADTIKGGDGGDIIEGGKGNDLLYGEKGNNVFVFNSGDGNDTIYSGNGADTLRFMGADNTQPLLDFDMASNEKDLIIYYGMDRTSTITVKDFYKKSAISETNPKGINPKCTVKNIQFGKDGDLIDIEQAIDDADTKYKDIVASGSGTNFDIKSTTQYIIGSDNDDTPNLENITTSPLYISLGEGNDTIDNKGKNSAFEITAGDGNKTITTGTANDKITVGDGTHNINAGDGDNIINAGDNTSTEERATVTTGSGADNITVGDGGYNINAGSGNDEITSGAGDDTITTGNGVDVISAGDGANEITTGNGKKTITVGNSTVKDPEDENFNKGSEITLSGQYNDNSTITTGTGDDTINIAKTSENIVIESTGGDNTINYATEASGSGAGINITTGDGADKITIGSANGGSTNNIINAGGGNNEVTFKYTNGTWGNVVETEDGNDIITFAQYTSESEVTTTGGENKITFGDHSDENSIKAGGSNTITFGETSEYNNILLTGSGKDSVEIKSGKYNIITAENGGAKTVTLGGDNTGTRITTGSGSDTVNINNNYSSSVMFTSSGGSNEINIDENGIMGADIKTGDGDDKYINKGHNGQWNNATTSTIDLGGGTNTVTIEEEIYNTEIKTGSGSDTIDLKQHGKNNKITTTGGDNTITYGSDMEGWSNDTGIEIKTGDGKDTITIGGYDEESKTWVGSVGGNTIDAGAGDNEISIAYGDDNTITTGDGNDKIYIANNAGNNSAYDNYIDAGDGNNEIELKSGENNTIKTGSGDDKITVYERGDNNTITSTGGNNEIYYGKGMSGQGGSESAPQKITTGAGNDKIYIGNVVDGEKNGGVNYITIDAGDGNNELYMGYNSAYGNIKTGSGNDKIYYNQGDENNFSYENTINAGAGDNEIYITKGYGYNITTGAGDDIITKGDSGGYNSESYKTTIYAGDGHNQITLGQGSYDITVGDSTVTDETDENYNIGSEININSQNSFYYLNIQSGNGDDTITASTGGQYTTSVVINAGDGDNHIEFANNEDGYIGYGATITTLDGDDTILVGTFDEEGVGKNSPTNNKINAGEGNNTIKIAYGNTNNITTGDGDDTIEIGKTTENVSNYNNVINAGNGNNTITVGNSTSSGNIVTITTGDGEDNITLGYSTRYSTITTGNGNKTITVGNNASDNTITTGTGDDKITLGYGSGNKVNTGDGADTVTMYSGTVNTGAGNDTVNLIGNSDGTNLTTGTGDDIIDVSKLVAACTYNINFNKGDGIDTIKGLTENGILRFNVTPEYAVMARRVEDTKNLALVMYNQEGIEVATDQIVIENYYNDSDEPVNINIYVNDMDIRYDLPVLLKGEETITGTNKNEFIIGSSKDDFIYPKGGKDTIVAGSGDDVIDLESDGYEKNIIFNRGDGNLTIKNQNANYNLYMEDIEAETTVFERHGRDMHIVRIVEDEITETVVLENVYPELDDGGINKNVCLYTKDGKKLGGIYDYPKVMHVYPDTETGILAGDIYVDKNYYYTNDASNRIVIPNMYTFQENYIYGANEGNVDTVDLSWCVSEGWTRWTRDGDNLVLTSVKDASAEDPWDDDNTVSTTIVDFFKEYNTVNKFKFESGTLDYTEISQLTQVINVNTSSPDEIEGTWINDRITTTEPVTGKTIYGNGGNDTISVTGSNNTIYGGDGKDTISVYGTSNTPNTIYGGAGNDTITGTNDGAEKFVFNLGDGHDTIDGGTLSGKTDRIVINFEDKESVDLTHSFNGRDLVLSYNYVDETPQDSITIENFLDENGVINSSIKYIDYGTFKTDQSLHSLFRADIQATEENKNIVGTPFNDILRTANADIEGITMNGGTGNDEYYTSRYEYTIECSDFGGHDYAYRNTAWQKAAYIKFTDLDLADKSKFKFALENNNMVIYYANSGDDTSADGYKFPNSIKLGEYNSQYDPENSSYHQINQLLGKDDTIETANPEYTILKLYQNVIDHREETGSFNFTKYRDVVYLNDAGETCQDTSAGEDIIYGGNGDDKIYHTNSSGKSDIYAGKGADEINAYNGDNTVHFSTGDGQDIVRFSAAAGQTLKFDNVDFNDLSFSFDREQNEFYINYGESDKVTVKGYISGVSRMYVEDQNGVKKNIQFAYTGGGAVGSDGLDIIYGTDSANNFTGKKGNDILYGEGGSDNYAFYNGDGNDIIRSAGGSSNLKFYNSSIEDIDFTKDGNNLIATYNNGADSVTIEDYYAEGDKQFKFTTSDSVEYLVKDDGRHYINDSESSTITGDIFNDYITVNTANTTISGGDGANVYTYGLADGVERTFDVNKTPPADTIKFTNWGDWATKSFTVDGDDIVVANSDESVKVRIKDGAKESKSLVLQDAVGNGDFLVNYLTSRNIYVVNDFSQEGTSGNDYIRLTADTYGGAASGKAGSDTIIVDRDGAAIYTNGNYGDGSPTNKDNTEETVDTVILNGTSNLVYAQSETNIITSNSETGTDSYRAYLDQTTTITDKGGTDSLILSKSDYSSTDGDYKISGALNTHLFFKVDADYDKDKVTFDVNIGKGSDMENAAQGNDHVGIFIKDNQVESISTSDGYSITSAQLATIAEQAAGWLNDKCFATYKDMLDSTGGEDLAKEYVSFINTQAQDYWQAPTP